MSDVTGGWPYIGVLASSRLVLTSYARRVLKINENGLTTRRSHREPPKRLMAPAKHSYFLATNGNTLDYLTYDFSLRHSRGF